MTDRATQDELAELRLRVARLEHADREQSGEQADERAQEQLTEAELRAAEMFKMTPAAYLRFKSVRPT